MNIGDKIKIKNGFSTFDPSDFILRRQDTTNDIEVEIVQILDEKHGYCLVKDSAGRTFPIEIPKVSDN